LFQNDRNCQFSSVDIDVDRHARFVKPSHFWQPMPVAIYVCASVDDKRECDPSREAQARHRKGGVSQ
jgi:hypothetical protein